tara:strand:+ start:1258 stop:1977 length:720 start_codon:yes stop_codon:yes gene_type:complete
MSASGNPTLIAGFEDIMKHITNQEKKIQELEKNNKEQQEKMKKHYQENQDLREVESLLQPFENTETFRMKVEKMMKDNQDLQKENDYQQTIIQNYSNDLDVYHNINNEYTEENKKLKEENQELKEKITCLESDSHNEVSQAEYDELEAEKKYLEHEVTRYSVALEEEYVLKSEYDELKEENEFLDTYEKQEAKDQIKKLQEYKDLDKDILVSDVNEKQDKISLLEAENKKLKKRIEEEV